MQQRIFMKYIQTILRGIGQVMFQNNVYSGALFLIGILYNSWLMGLAALAGTIISTGVAQVLSFSKEEIENGLYGFNGTLTGIAILCFFEVNSVSISALILGSVLSTLLMYSIKKFLLPYTAPFVVATWLVMFLVLSVFNLQLLPSSEPSESLINIFTASITSFGQVMFQENIITGLFFLMAIVVNNRLMAIYAIYAAVLGSLTGWFYLENAGVANAGLMGYNAILCAIALTGKRWQDFLWITIAVILSTLLNIGLGLAGIITLTAPFVLVTWVVWKLKLQTAVVKGLS